jgi:hypothetical protein
MILATSAHAGTEEFSTFSVVEQQVDDESLLDHLLTRVPRSWRDAWERSPDALQSSQGCLTSGEWLIDTRLKVRAPLGDQSRSTFGLDVRDQHTDALEVQYFDFSFRFPTRAGTPGAFFRPLFDKSRQDFGIFWELGADTTELAARLTFTFEDAFNNLWAFRQTQVGEDSEPYERHPYEPALWFRWRRPTARAELGGQWLTPSRKRFESGGPDRHATLWGTLGYGALEARVLGVGLELAAEDRQALAREAPAGAALYGGNFRRQWSVESAARRALGPSLELEARWIYRQSEENSDPPFPLRRLATVDRALQLEARAMRGRFGGRVGGLHDRISVDREGEAIPGYASRIESRAYLGLSARFGRVTLDAVEGIELDPEPYDVWGVHDKAFAHLQTTF